MVWISSRFDTDRTSDKNVESNLVRATQFWNNLHQVRSKPKHLKAK